MARRLSRSSNSVPQSHREASLESGYNNNFLNVERRPSWRSGSVLDITKIQDERNPKLKKRKRVPVDAHDFETNLGINSQVQHAPAAEAQPSTSNTPVAPQSIKSISVSRMVQVANMTTWNNTRLTLLIVHMTGMIKRAIDKALAPVHFKIQDLEHRLYPDLRIFDVPLHEDEVFEDDSIEKNEEEQKDDHVTKELDDEP
ncbi:hypothetical protein HAX54_050068 [Datura stramonium]|uniref:Uncharacterized protein n=1 Tax=Datura stramonium TaxID=4076 RepID=A0ABS8RU87_DATST|nr:hypothetical protein [Datura stramonium]